MSDEIANAKIDLTQLLQLSKDALHVHISLIVFLLAVLIFRRRMGAAWLIVLGAEVVNEVADYLHSSGAPGWQAAAAHDILNTMFWPTVLLGLVKLGRLKLR